jgi:HEAT repeat protein
MTHAPQRLAALACLGGLIGLPATVCAYVDGAPSLGAVVNGAGTCVVLAVEKVNREKRLIYFKKAEDLRGRHDGAAINHRITDGAHPREPAAVLDWAEPGRRAIFYHTGQAGLVCLGRYWYEVAAGTAPWWTMTQGRPELSFAYFGSVERLRKATLEMLAGNESVITAVKHDEGRWATYADVAFRNVIRGREWPVIRVRASLKMPAAVYGVTRQPNLIVGPGSAGAEDVAALRAGLSDADAAVRLDAAIELGAAGEAAAAARDDLARALTDMNPFVRLAGAEALARLDPMQDKPLAVLLEGARSKAAGERRFAVESLGNLGPVAKPAVEPLTAALKDGDAGVRSRAAEALGQIGPEAASAVARLIDALKDPAVRPAAIDALGKIGAAAEAAVPALARYLTSDPATRRAAALALGRLGPKGAKIAVPHLTAGLASTDDKTRWNATIVLWTIGPAARDAVPAVAASIKAGNEMAIDALTAIDIKAAVPFLVRNRLKSPNADFRRMAAEQLGNAGVASAEVLEALKAAQSDADEGVRNAAGAALTRLKK